MAEYQSNTLTLSWQRAEKSALFRIYTYYFIFIPKTLLCMWSPMHSHCSRSPRQAGLEMKKMRSKCWLSILPAFYIYSHTCLTIVGFFSPIQSSNFRGMQQSESWLWSQEFLHCIKNPDVDIREEREDSRGPGRLIGRHGATTVQNRELSDPLPALSQTVQALSSHGRAHTSTRCVVKAWRACGQAVWRNNWQHGRKRERETRSEEETSPGGKCC